MGLNWLRRFNPLIDWRSATMQFRPVYDESVVLTPPETTPAPVAISPVTEKTETPASPALPPSILLTSSPDSAPSMEVPPGPSMDIPEAPAPRPFTSAPLVSLVNAAAYSAII